MLKKYIPFLILLFCVLGCKYLIPVETSDNQNTKTEMDWSDLPDKQPAKISVPVYTESLGDLLPKKLGKFKLTESHETVQSFSGADQTWVAYYQSSDGIKLHLYLQRFNDFDKAYSALIAEAAARVVAEVTKIETAIKNNREVGTKVCLKAPGENNPKCSTVLWTNGSIAVSLSSYNNIDTEDIHLQLPF